MSVKCGTLTVGKKVENGFNSGFEVLYCRSRRYPKVSGRKANLVQKMKAFCPDNSQLSFRLLFSVVLHKDECPESKMGMIPDVAGMTIQTPRHCKVVVTSRSSVYIIWGLVTVRLPVPAPVQ